MAALAFVAVAYLPGLLTVGSAGAASDLQLGALLAQGSALAFAVAFAGGVATSLTPCVYPLIPITVSIFGARKAGRRRDAVALSGLYVLGIATMYSALGVGAALTGRAFGSVMQNSWVIGGVAIFFAAMAASMFGAFELQLPAAWQARLEAVGGAGRAGAFAMGLVSGIVAAPCTGPVLAAALTFVATKGSVVFGFAIMFAYALGLGLLFFVIGTFSISLPKSGAWMDGVKSVFGVALLAAALVFLKNALPASRALFSAGGAAALAAGGVAAAGVLLGALHGDFHGGVARSAAKGLGVALLVGAIVYASGAADARARHRAAEGFAWRHDERGALALAQAEGRPVILDFWADWCTACKELDQLAWADPRVREEAARFVAVKVDGTDDTPEFQALLAKYAVVGMPTVIFVDSRGRETPLRVTAAIDGPAMLEVLRGVDGACDAPIPAKADALAAVVRPGGRRCPARW